MCWEPKYGHTRIPSDLDERDPLIAGVCKECGYFYRCAQTVNTPVECAKQQSINQSQHWVKCDIPWWDAFHPEWGVLPPKVWVCDRCGAISPTIVDDFLPPFFPEKCGKIRMTKALK